MFAKYYISKRGGNQQYLGLSSFNFEAFYKKKYIKIPLHELAKVVLEKRRKLAPLVLGGIITSLSLLSIMLYSSSLEIVGLAAFGLLLTYYGLQEYVVIHIEYSNATQLIWLPSKVTLKSVRPFIAILEYYITKHHFPILYATTSNNRDTLLVHFENKPVVAKSSIIYNFSKKQITNNQVIAINLALVDAPIVIEDNDNNIGIGKYLINHAAVIEENSINYS